MSAEQLSKLQKERDALTAEFNMMKTSKSADEASALIIDAIGSGDDPLQHPDENPWITRDPTGCHCVVM